MNTCDHGIPNKAYPHCTRELKLNPMYSFIESLGWAKGSYQVAVGMRTDEMRRVRRDAAKVGIIYPLIDMFPMDKVDVNDWWESQPFALKLKEHQGNCKWCWKKSLRKHGLLAKETPEVYEFPLRMESKYGLSGHNIDGNPRVFHRQNMSTLSLLESLKGGIVSNQPYDPDDNSGCSESC